MSKTGHEYAVKLDTEQKINLGDYAPDVSGGKDMSREKNVGILGA